MGTQCDLGLKHANKPLAEYSPWHHTRSANEYKKGTWIYVINSFCLQEMLVCMLIIMHLWVKERRVRSFVPWSSDKNIAFEWSVFSSWGSWMHALWCSRHEKLHLCLTLKEIGVEHLDARTLHYRNGPLKKKRGIFLSPVSYVCWAVLNFDLHVLAHFSTKTLQFW